MRWRLAFTPIYALLSERGGNSITLCPFSSSSTSARLESNLSAELEATERPQDGQASTATEDSSSSPTPIKQTVDTRVLLAVSVVEDAIHDVSHWVSWLTTAAPWDVTKVDVQVHSIFKSYSTLVVISLPTSAWDRLPERSAYKFIGFVRSGDIFHAARTSMTSSAERASTRGELPLASQEAKRLGSYGFEELPSSFPSFLTVPVQTPDPETTPSGPDEMKTPTQNTKQPLSSVYKRGAADYSEFDLQNQSINQHHKRQRTDSVAQVAAKVQVPHSPTVLDAAAATAALDKENFPESSTDSYPHRQGWSPENDDLLIRARQEGLNWEPIASLWFPDKSANACRKRHKRLMENLNISDGADLWDGVKMETLAKAYVDVRERMWKLLAERLGEKWQNVEAKVYHPTCDSTKYEMTDKCSSAWRKASKLFGQQAAQPHGAKLM